MALELDVGECLTWKSCGEQGHIARKVFQGRVVFLPTFPFSSNSASSGILGRALATNAFLVYLDHTVAANVPFLLSSPKFEIL